MIEDTGPLKQGQEEKFLGDYIMRTERGYRLRPNPKLIETFLACLGLEAANSTKLPGLKSDAREPDEEPKLLEAAAGEYRVGTGKGLFIARRRGDTQYPIKECARDNEGAECTE